MTKSYRRRVRLVRPKLQMRLMASFLGVAVLALSLQYMVFLRVLAAAATELPNDGAIMMGEIAAHLGLVFLVSLLGLLPATFVVGLLVTHRVVGPLYRFETYLTQLLSGETKEPCRIRKGDELQELCDLINRSTEPLRATQDAPASEEGEVRRVA
jgi:nitrogen fixation/metabolism regulation signal transduction histidine kinase